MTDPDTAATIPFDNLPGFPALWRSYRELAAAGSASAIGTALQACATLEALIERARTFAPPEWPRERLLDALATTLADVGLDATDAEQRAMDLLSRDETVAIVTGQQPGLLGGPAFVVYKALSALRLANTLTAAGQPAVAIFWVAGEDHDWLEGNQAHVPDEHGRWRRRTLDLPATREPLRDRPVGELGARRINELLDTLTAPPLFAVDEATRKQLRANVCSPADTLATWQLRFLHAVFAETGLLFIEPGALRRHGGGDAALRFALSRHDRFEALLAEQAQRLAADPRADGRFAPDPQRHLHLFLDAHALPVGSPIGDAIDVANDRGLAQRGRRRLWPAVTSEGAPGLYVERDDDAYGVDVQAAVADAPVETWLRVLDDHGDAFSCNYLSRPLVQAASIPALAYVGGPDELRYQCLLPPVLDELGLSRPVLLPRMSISIVPPGHAAAAREAVCRIDAITRDAREHTPPAEAEIAEALAQAHAELAERVRAVAPGVQASLDALGRRVDRDTHRVARSLNQDPLRFLPAGTRAELEPADPVLFLLGNGRPASLQERVLPAVAAVAQLGLDRLRTLAAESALASPLNVPAFEHVLLESSPPAGS